MRNEQPNRWKLSRFGSFAWEVSERSASKKEEVLSVTKYRGFVPSLEYFGKQVFSKDVQNYKLVKRGQFAYATIHLDEGSIDSLRIRDEGIISPMYTVFDTDPDRIDRTFLLELLQTPLMLNRYAAISQGSINRRKSISFETLAAETILLPPLPEQRKIAAILSSVDEAIQATQAVIEQTRRVKEGLLQELLTKGIGHTRFKQTPIGEIPEGWEVRTLADIAARIGDGIHSTPHYSDAKTAYPFINGNNLKNGKIHFSTDQKCVEQAEFELHKRDLGEQTILMSINGTIGNLSFFRGETVVLGKSAAYINLFPDVNKRFIFHVLESQRVQGFYNLEVTGTTIRNLSLKTIRSTQIALPSKDEQQEIATIFSSVEQAEEAARASLKAKQATKSGLLQDLLTGKVRVSV